MALGKRVAASQGAVVVTGASAGVGRATALAFARRGARVALIARGTEGLEAARREARRPVPRKPWPCRRTRPMPRPSSPLPTAPRRSFGGIGTWVNCAMATVFAPVQAMTPEEFRRVTEVTYLGYVHGTLAALRHMRPRDAGTIVQVGSALAYRAIPLQSAYCAAKSRSVASPIHCGASCGTMAAASA
ncbi:SDR family NAD(P)-dependent oxidoreductase [Dankookia sp. P2]|uniref:SDR family NAD(P)-dependent oxidoreductase n=1 Tax=Dankookia sp. P2 TaxID=3423955 RepID=UPI003D66DDDF